VFEGQFFTELRRDIHGFTGDPPPGWTFRAIDYGESAPSSVGWYRVDYDGNLWRYRELYGPGMLYSELGDKICEMTPDNEDVHYTVASPDIFGKSKGTGVVGSETLEAHGVTCQPADNNRVDGWRHMKEFLHRKKLFVHTDNCRHWWRTVPAMVYDTLKPEDMDGNGEDHAAEECRYACMSRPRPALPPKEPIDPFSAQAIDEKVSGALKTNNDGFY
jgi:hypothetical protein